MFKRLFAQRAQEAAAARRPWLGWICLGWVVGFVGAGPLGIAADSAVAVVMDEQTVTLRAGWNAVCLRVDPLEAAPGAQLGGLPVDKVAAYFPSRTPVEFIQDPAAQPWKQKGWGIWYAPDLPEGPLSNLHALSAGQGYLVHATAAATWKIRGTVVHRRIRWRADSFNLVGFPVDPNHLPTFGAWFAGSSAHQGARRPAVYALGEDDRWQPVVRPESTLVQPGTAYWVYCDGASDFQGPIDVIVGSGGAGETQVRFGSELEKLPIRLANAGPFPTALTAELVPSSGLPLFEERRDLSAGTRSLVPLGGSSALGTLEAAGRREVRVVIDRAAMTSSDGAALLMIRSDNGVLIRLPVTAQAP